MGKTLLIHACVNAFVYINNVQLHASVNKKAFCEVSIVKLERWFLKFHFCPETTIYINLNQRSFQFDPANLKAMEALLYYLYYFM